MGDLLFLAHRIPYPPNKGDKIRSWHILRHLLEAHRVHLACFIDDPQDRIHIERLQQLCASCCMVNLAPRTARLLSLRGLLSGEPLTLPYYRNARMRRYVEDVARRYDISAVFTFSSAMAPYALSHHYSNSHLIVDFVDVDSEKWRAYGATMRGPTAWIYSREADRLLEFEKAVAARANASLFVSEAEAALFRKLAPDCVNKIDWVENGVDCDYFSPDVDLPTPYPTDQPVVVFTGAMDYWPNVDAVRYFSSEIWPLVRKARPDALFYVVGARPDPEIAALNGHNNISVTGQVTDIRPYLAHARLSIAPMQIARGIQNKVLEAMAMAKPAVVSPQALEGINARPGTHLVLAEDTASFAKGVLNCLTNDSAADLGRSARRLVRDEYAWSAKLKRLDAVLEGSGAKQPVSSSW